jgi:hypothetical protein
MSFPAPKLKVAAGGMRNLIMEQMPWLNNPNNPIPIVDPADIKALWQQSKDLEAQPRQPGSMLIINRKAVACSSGADIASVVYRLGMLELANTAMGLNFPVTLNGKPTDAVFKAFATIPMLGIHEGGSNTPRFAERVRSLATTAAERIHMSA